MLRFDVCKVMLCLAVGACAVEDVTGTSTVEQAGISLQGISLQGISLQGISLQGMSLLGYRVNSGTLNGDTLRNVRVSRGELVAERAGTTLRGRQLAGARFLAEARNTRVSPPATQLVEFQITAIDPELDRYDPTDTGHTFLYTLEQRNGDTGAWQAACPADDDGRRVAIPLDAIFDERGDRIESDSLFTFGCTTGVIAKCYRWGYRPWVTGYGDLAEMHWTCTRMARADYCGNGVPHTRNGTSINLWDRIPSPGPIQRRAGLLSSLGMLFEAGWTTRGAACMSTGRWLLDDGLAIAQLCPDHLVPPGLLLPTVCDTIASALLFAPEAKMFNESYLLNVLDL
jgi:ADYC domain